jgi:hypothetical protein
MDHVDSHESDYRLSYPFYGAVQPQSYLEVRVRENFGAARFSTFFQQYPPTPDVRVGRLFDPKRPAQTTTEQVKLMPAKGKQKSR